MSTEYSVRHIDRAIPRISLRDFDARMDDITAELVAAAEKYGVFVLTDHPVSQSAIDAQFAATRGFFDLADAVKEKTPFATSANAGWEKNSQRSTGCVDRQESHQMYQMYQMYQMQSSDEHMAGRWVADDDLPGFRTQSLAFMQACRSLSTKLMVCLARGLGLEDDQALLNAHDITQPNIQTVLRALHCFALDPAAPTPTPTSAPYDRAGPHAGWSFLTLLFQRPGQSGLEIRPISQTSQTSQTSQIGPGRDAVTDFGQGDDDSWTQIKPVAGEIVCSIGDLLMYWSDDRYKSALHRIKTPTDPAVDDYGDRYSLAFFNQPNSDCVVQGPQHKHPRVTGRACTQLATKRNVAQIKEQERQKKERQERQAREERAAQKEMQSAMTVPSVEFQATTSFSPYTGSMDAGDAAAASAAFSMAACMASAAAMTASMM